jgi:hypothetical protein
MAVMFPFSEAALKRRELEPEKYKPKTYRKGQFRRQPMRQAEVRLRADSTRNWLLSVLFDGPRLASEVLELAKLEGISRCGLYRAKYHYGVLSIRTGGIAYKGRWCWQFPTTKP